MSALNPKPVADMNQVVANNLRAELSRQRWSDRKAAIALGVNNNFISRRTRGETPLTPADIAMFADLLRVPVAKFFELPHLDSNQEPIVFQSSDTPDDRDNVVRPMFGKPLRADLGMDRVPAPVVPMHRRVHHVG